MRLILRRSPFHTYQRKQAGKIMDDDAVLHQQGYDFDFQGKLF